MPRFDFACTHCDRTDPNVYIPVSDVSLPRDCFECGHPMTKLPVAPNFTVRGFTAANGYSKS